MKTSLAEAARGALAHMKRERAWVAFGIAVIAAGVLSFTGNGDQTQMLFSTCLFIVLAYGWNIISGLTGYVSFGQVGFFGIGAYAAATCQIFFNMDWYLATAVGGLVTVGRALMRNPQLLILDEPSTGLAPRVVGELYAALRVFNREGLAVFVVEQNAYAALRFAERGYVFEDGRITRAARANDLLQDPHLVEAYVGHIAQTTDNQQI